MRRVVTPHTYAATAPGERFNFVKHGTRRTVLVPDHILSSLKSRILGDNGGDDVIPPRYPKKHMPPRQKRPARRRRPRLFFVMESIISKLLSHIITVQIGTSVIATCILCIFFMMDPVASWHARPLTLESSNGTSFVSTWYLTVSVVCIAAASFVAALLQRLSWKAVKRSIRSGVNEYEFWERLCVEPVLMGTLAVLAGMTNIISVILTVVVVAAGIVMSYLTNVVQFVVRSTGPSSSSLRASRPPFHSSGNHRDSPDVVIQSTLFSFRYMRLSAVTLSAIVRIAIIGVWSQNSDAPWLTPILSGTLLTTICVFTLCDLVALLLLNWPHRGLSSIVPTVAHFVALRKLSCFAVAMTTVVVLSQRLLSP